MHRTIVNMLVRFIFLNFPLLFVPNLKAVEPSIKFLTIKKIDNISYKVECDMSFPNVKISILHDFCWNINNIVKILSNEPAKIQYRENNNFIWISYEYDYLLFHHNSTYKRSRTDKKDSICFEMLTNNHNIPFIPTIKRDTGFYAFSIQNNITTIHYNQNVICDKEISALYFNNIHKKATQYFNSFILEGEKYYEP